MRTRCPYKSLEFLLCHVWHLNIPLTRLVAYCVLIGSWVTLGSIDAGASRITTDRTIFTDSLIIKRRITYDSLTYLTDLNEVTIASDILELSDKLGIVDRMNTTGLTNSLKNFIKAEGNLGMDIDKTEKQLKHIETLNMMSNFSTLN